MKKTDLLKSIQVYAQINEEQAESSYNAIIEAISAEVQSVLKDGKTETFIPGLGSVNVGIINGKIELETSELYEDNKNKTSSKQIEQKEKFKPILRTEVPHNRKGLQKIAGCENIDRIIDIIFIHGLDGNSWTSWMADKEDIKTFWPNWLAIDFPNMGLWTLGYVASSSKWKEDSMPLKDRGTQILDLLESENIGDRPIVFITHSMGGIIVKYLLQNAENYFYKPWKRIAKKTKGIVFIATPHAGSNLANFLELVSFFYQTNENVTELAAHNKRLHDLNGWFLSFREKRKIECKSYYEERETKFGISLLKVGTRIVDAISAEPNIPSKKAIPVDADHFSICKPTSREDPIYKSISHFINDCQKIVIKALKVRDGSITVNNKKSNLK